MIISGHKKRLESVLYRVALVVCRDDTYAEQDQRRRRPPRRRHPIQSSNLAKRFLPRWKETFCQIRVRRSNGRLLPRELPSDTACALLLLVNRPGICTDWGPISGSIGPFIPPFVIPQGPERNQPMKRQVSAFSRKFRLGTWRCCHTLAKHTNKSVL